MQRIIESPRRGKRNSAHGFLCAWVSAVQERLFAADSQAIDANCRRGDGSAEFQVVCDFGDVHEHVFQVAGDRDLFHRIRKLAAGNPQPDAPRE